MSNSGENIFIHAGAICESENIGTGTRIWAFAHILPGAKIGEDVNLCDHTFIENDVIVGDRVTIKCFVALWDGIRIDDDAFIGPNVTFANDKYPRSKKYHATFPETFIRKGASICSGAIILPGVDIGAYSMVGAGSVVSKNVAPFALVKGSPAKSCGFVCICGASLNESGDGFECSVGSWKGSAPSLDMKCDR